jgi:hypothetical protein
MFSNGDIFGSSAASVGMPVGGEQIVVEEKIWAWVLGKTERYTF